MKNLGGSGKISLLEETKKRGQLVSINMADGMRLGRKKMLILSGI